MPETNRQSTPSSPMRRAFTTAAVFAVVVALVAYFGRRNDPTPAP